MSIRGSRAIWPLTEPGLAARVCAAAILTWLLTSFLLLPRACAAEPAAPLEYQVKAAFLLNFTKFIDWPQTESAGTDPPFEICLLGDDPFGIVLDQMLEGETLQGRKLTVQKVHRPVPASCKVLFIGKSEKDVGSLLSSLGPGVLTVGEANGFLRDGGMVDFVIENRRVRFDVNQAAAVRAGLRISSKLLNVARLVEK